MGEEAGERRRGRGSPQPTIVPGPGEPLIDRALPPPTTCRCPEPPQPSLYACLLSEATRVPFSCPRPCSWIQSLDSPANQLVLLDRLAAAEARITQLEQQQAFAREMMQAAGQGGGMGMGGRMGGGGGDGGGTGMASPQVAALEAKIAALEAEVRVGKGRVWCSVERGVDVLMKSGGMTWFGGRWGPVGGGDRWGPLAELVGAQCTQPYAALPRPACLSCCKSCVPGSLRCVGTPVHLRAPVLYRTVAPPDCFAQSTHLRCSPLPPNPDPRCPRPFPNPHPQLSRVAPGADAPRLVAEVRDNLDLLTQRVEQLTKSVERATKRIDSAEAGARAAEEAARAVQVGVVGRVVPLFLCAPSQCMRFPTFPPPNRHLFRSARWT